MASPLDRVTRLAELSTPDRRELDAVLDAGHPVASLSTVLDGQPWVVPMLYARVDDRIVLHGSTGAGALRAVAAGAPAALCVVHLDGWVYAHTLFDSSANYRSAVVRGPLALVTGEQAVRALDDLSDRVFPGRRAEVPAHTRKQLAATRTLAMDIVEGSWTVKISAGQPDPDDDTPADLWTGVLPIHSGFGPPQPADRVPPGVPVSPSVERLRNARPDRRVGPC